MHTAIAAVGGRQKGQHWLFLRTGLEHGNSWLHVRGKHSISPPPPRGQRHDWHSSCFHNSPACFFVPSSSIQTSSAVFDRSVIDDGSVVGGHMGQHNFG